mmetsp:Transcript_1517/g.2674  ORF Transcript_1517/g.2674 Transcript_1517/m.2674 type:complete len:140 (-) Transcript_1517:19-438(-)
MRHMMTTGPGPPTAGTADLVHHARDYTVLPPVPSGSAYSRTRKDDLASRASTPSLSNDPHPFPMRGPRFTWFQQTLGPSSTLGFSNPSPMDRIIHSSSSSSASSSSGPSLYSDAARRHLRSSADALVFVAGTAQHHMHT